MIAQRKEFPVNILVVGGGSWDDTSSLGNTLSNLFAEWKNASFYNLYFRDVMPNNAVCTDYYRITTKEILKKYWAPQNIGEPFEIPADGSSVDVVEQNRKGDTEKKMISLIHRYGVKFIYELEDLLWYTKKWQNRRLDEFIDHVNPDIIFSFAAGNSYMVLPIEYIKARTNAKLILLVADDMYTTYRLSQNRHHLRMQKDFDKLIGMADKIYGISEQMFQRYEALYGVRVDILHKGCCFEHGPMRKVNKPIRLVYAGNLLFGRLDTLAAVADCLETLNKSGIKATLDVYSGTIITEQQRKRIHRGNISAFHGCISFSEVKEKLASADVVVHVESFDEEQIECVRYSFSTKIIDCLQSGSVLLAIGPKGIASIEYSRKVPGAEVVDDLRLLEKCLCRLLSEEMNLISRAKQIHSFAVENHSIDRVRQRLQNDFEHVVDAQK